MANRTVLGEFDGDYVLRVSRPGHNVLNPNLARKNLAFDSRWPETMQIASAGHYDVPQGSNFSFAHGLSYTRAPIAFLWADYGGRRWQLNAGSVCIQGVGAYIRGWVTTTHVQVSQSNASVAFRLQYVLLRQANG